MRLNKSRKYNGLPIFFELETEYCIVCESEFKKLNKDKSAINIRKPSPPLPKTLSLSL
jgi:hypothetical protein